MILKGCGAWEPKEALPPCSSGFMRIHLLAVSHRVPLWAQQAYEEYSKRMPRECTLVLCEVAAEKRQKGQKKTGSTLIKNKEGERLIAHIPQHSRVIALDEHGKQQRSQQLATKMAQWMMGGQDVTLLIGGADGLSEQCLSRADETWSLSELTFPHVMVRVMVAEQLYRAYSIMHNHPYHRE